MSVICFTAVMEWFGLIANAQTIGNTLSWPQFMLKNDHRNSIQNL